jgi:hypothetical protein
MKFALCYFGLTRSTKQVYTTHIEHVFNVLEKHGISCTKFMHTWKTKDNKQKVWETIVPQEIDYDEYKLLSPDVYNIDNQDEFLKTMNIDDYFYKKEPIHSEWLEGLVKNHICALESMKRSFAMVDETYDMVIIIRPDAEFKTNLPIDKILEHKDKASIPNFDHWEGYNDRFACMNYKNAYIYANRLDELIEYRKNHGRIVSEKCLKFILDKNNIPVNLIEFPFCLIRPS